MQASKSSLQVELHKGRLNSSMQSVANQGSLLEIQCLQWIECLGSLQNSLFETLIPNMTVFGDTRPVGGN